LAVAAFLGAVAAFLGAGAAFFAAVTSTSFKVRPLARSRPSGSGGPRPSPTSDGRVTIPCSAGCGNPRVRCPKDHTVGASSLNRQSGRAG
jgi:hypothetical protein